MTRFLSAVAVLAIAVIAGIISYTHIEVLALANGQGLLAARLLPVSVDGAIVAASMTLLDYARRGVQAPRLARILLAAAISATVLANAVSGLPHGTVGVGVAMLPALLFTGSVELFIGMVRSSSGQAQEPEPLSSPEPAPEGVQKTVDASPSPARTGARRPLPTNRPTSRGMSPAPAEIFADMLAAGRVPGVRAIKREMHCGQDRAVQIKDQLSSWLPQSPVPAEVTS
jgi:hypothetical protein